MTTHPKDTKADNPRIQCSACGQWKRHRSRHPHPPHDLRENFFGGCGFSNGDHLAGDHIDVCEPCCQTACRQMKEQPAWTRDPSQLKEGNE